MNQVSELLGSFGDNELSPECLDGAQWFLKPDGISIPSSYWTLLLNTSFLQSLSKIFFISFDCLLVILYRYTSFIQPITASKLHNDVGVYYHFSMVTFLSNLNMISFLQIKAHKDIAHFETSYVVKLHHIATLSPPQPVRPELLFYVLHCLSLSDLVTFLTMWYFRNLFALWYSLTSSKPWISRFLLSPIQITQMLAIKGIPTCNLTCHQIWVHALCTVCICVFEFWYSWNILIQVHLFRH
jgi:hypothetical protein